MSQLRATLILTILFTVARVPAEGLLAAKPKGRSGASAAAAPASGGQYVLEDEKLAFELLTPDKFRLKNKLTGKVFADNASSFELSVESGDQTVRLSGADFAQRSLARLAPDSLKITFDGAKQLPGLRVEAVYSLARGAWFVRKHLKVTNAAAKPISVREANVEVCRIEGVALPDKAENPMFLDGQLFWGLEWPIASAAIQDGRLVFGHLPGVSLAPGASWTSKTCGFGVSEAGRANQAFGLYIQEIRANRVDFATFYFDWLCHDNSGPLESEILANFAALKRLKELYGLQFDIYNSDAGLVEAPQTYFPKYRAIFDKRFPDGLKKVADASAALKMSLGLWIGPDGFGEKPEEMKARQEQLVSWVRDFNVGLFKLDTVVSPLNHKDRFILEKKYQSLADAIAEGRRINPKLVVINHRVNQSPYMLTITDCLLWRGEETYIDVHINNLTDSLYNRDCSINRSLTSEFFDVPFRQFEDHGICFNSCLEKWDNDLVAQAFGRASVLSPEMYGTFFFLRDDEYPRLARLIQLHKQSERMLRRAYALPGGDVAHSDGRSALLVLRNPSWEPATKSVALDATIGLKAAAGAPLTVRQRHPHELLLAGKGGYKAGGTLEVDLEPFDLRLIQVDVDAPSELFLGGIPYDVIPGSDPATYDINLRGEPGCEYDVTVHNGKGQRITVDGQPLAASPAAGARWRVAFPGKKAAGPFFSVLGDCTEVALAPGEGVRLAEFAKFLIDDEALESRVLRQLDKQPSKLPEIEACRDYMRRKLIEAEGTCRNAFDGDPTTRWSDGYPRRGEYSYAPAPYRSATSLWRIDFGTPVPLAKLELHVVRRTESAFLESAEVSADMKEWTKVGGLSLKATETMPQAQQTSRRGKKTDVYDVGEGAPVVVTVDFPENKSRFLKLHGRDFSVSEIVGYDREGKRLDSSQWKATNFHGESVPPARALRLTQKLHEHWPGQELAVAVKSGAKKLSPMDGAMVVVNVGGEIFVPPQRAPSYPYHTFEANAAWLMNRGLDGMTFRLPTRPEWAGREIEVTVLLQGEGAEGSTARVRIVTPEKPAATKTLSIRASQ